MLVTQSPPTRLIKLLDPKGIKNLSVGCSLNAINKKGGGLGRSDFGGGACGGNGAAEDVDADTGIGEGTEGLVAWEVGTELGTWEG